MSLALKPTHATVKAYYETLHQYGQLHIDHEGAVRSAFQELLAKSGRRANSQLTLVRSVDEILQEEFGRSLGDKGVHILDPFVGTEPGSLPSVEFRPTW